MFSTRHSTTQCACTDFGLVPGLPRSLTKTTKWRSEEEECQTWQPIIVRFFTSNILEVSLKALKNVYTQCDGRGFCYSVAHSCLDARSCRVQQTLACRKR